jgi:hypothetical protein
MHQTGYLIRIFLVYPVLLFRHGHKEILVAASG